MKINKQGEFVDEEPPNPYSRLMLIDLTLIREREAALNRKLNDKTRNKNHGKKK